MLERLVGRLLNNVLSQYFVYNNRNDEDSNNNGSGNHQNGGSESTTEGGASLGVWSGYIALDNLRLKNEVVNDLLQKHGIPVEVLHCTIRRVEITVPWSKLSSSSSSRSGTSTPTATDSTGAVVVIVMDGIHILARTRYEFHDAKMRSNGIRQRRDKLEEASTFERPAQTPQQQSSSSSSWFGVGSIKDFVQRRISEGLIHQIIDKLHVHIRDVHIRLEDAETDAAHPFACGIIMESMHVQHCDDDYKSSGGGVREDDDHNELFPQDDDNNSSTRNNKETIRKVAQVNHYAIYWNALGYEKGLPLEHAVLHQVQWLQAASSQASPQFMADALDRAIARRASALWSAPGGRLVVPTHTYLLMPVDCTLQATITMDRSGNSNNNNSENINNHRPSTNSSIPSIEATFHVDAVNVQLRDFQCHQISLLIHTMKNHNFTRPYRTFRPQVTVHEDPAAWWRYAFRVVKCELKGSRLRWSWGRMRQTYAGRHRYCELYERKLKYNFYSSHSVRARSQNNLSGYLEATFDTTPDEGAGPSLQNDTNSVTASQDSSQQPSTNQQQQQQETPRALTGTEIQELQDLEDGVIGDMSVQDLLLYRLLVHNRLGQNYQAKQQQAAAQQTLAESWVFGNTLVQNAMRDDFECQLEVQRLMAYLDHTSAVEESSVDLGQDQRNILFLSIRFHWKEGCLAIFSPLPSTANESSFLRRLHERFLDFRFEQLSLGVSLMGDFETANVNVSLRDYKISEIRANQDRQAFSILSRRQPCSTKTANGAKPKFDSRARVSFSEEEDNGEEDNVVEVISQESRAPVQSPLFFAEICINPPKEEACGTTVKAKLEAVEVVLLPDCQWIWRLGDFLRLSSASVAGNLENYWKDLNYASINAWASRSLGLRAKVETAMKEHSAVNLDIEIDCPLIQIVGEGNKKIWIDLGKAHLKTIKLAGVSSIDLDESLRIISESQFNKKPSRARSQSNASGLQDPTADLEASDRSLDRALKASIPSLDTFLGSHKRKQSVGLGDSVRSGGIFEGDRTVNITLPGDASVTGRQDDGIQSSFFYDVHQLHINTGDAVVGESCDGLQGSSASELQHRFVSGFQLHINIHKSIIPADHTICRFRIDCILGEISATLSPATIVYMANILHTWKTVMANASSTSLPTAQFIRPIPQPKGFINEVSEPEWITDEEDKPQNASLDSNSHVDEDEFFDAVENGDENSENLSMWLEDNWIADADSVLDGDQGSTTQKQRRQRAAMSDVSSLSDRSLMRRRKKKGAGSGLAAYLNEENLAMLEEGMVEEDSIEGGDNDTDSFHSALSPGNLANLLEELDKGIKEARERLSQAKDKLGEMTRPRKDQSLSSFSSDSSKHRRLLKRSLLIEQERLRAELKEMVATRHDLSVQLAVVDQAIEDAETSSRASVGGNVGFIAPARRASLLLNTRKNHDKSFDATAMQHSLTRNLNPQLLQCTFFVSKVTFCLSEIESAEGGVPLDTILCFSQGGLTVRHSVNETKLFLSVESVAASYRNSTGSDASQRYVFVGGSQYSLASRLLPSHFPQFISSVSMDDKFIKCTLELRHRPATNNSLTSPEIVRLRLAVGDLETTPEPQLLEALASCSVTTQKKMHSFSQTNRSTTTSKVEKSKKPSGPMYLDISAALASVRVVLNHSKRPVAALALSEVAFRFAQSNTDAVFKNRHQIDFRCTNIQVLHIEDLQLGKGSEVLGRRDPYLPLVQSRVKSQLVPLAEVGGWAVGSKASSNQALASAGSGEAWNVHAGVKVNCMAITATGQAILQVKRGVERLLSVKSILDQNVATSGSCTEADQTLPDDAVVALDSVASADHDEAQLPVRWRFDVIVRKTTVSLLGKEGPEWDGRDGTRNSLLLTWTLLASFEDCPQRDGVARLQIALTETSLMRPSDELYLLEPLDILLKGHSPFLKQQSKSAQSNLKLPVDSSWNEIAAVMHRHGWDVSRDDPQSDAPTCIGLLVTAAKINLSAQLCGTLLEVATSFSFPGDSQQKKLKTSNDPEMIVGSAPDFDLVVALNSFDLVLLHEIGGRSTDSFASFVLTNLELSLKKRASSLWLNTKLTDFLIFDLSSRPGVCTLSRKYYKNEPETTEAAHANCDTLSVKVEINESEGKMVARIDLHFGDIKCVVLPALLLGILSFKKEIVSLLPNGGTNSERNVADETKGVGFSRHVDFFFSFVVDGFECVFSSREIPSYTREQSHEPINVVSFRWKSSGDAVLVLCSVDEATMMKRKMATKGGNDTGLTAQLELEDFVGQISADRHLSADSRLFASKIDLAVTKFQVLRTSIVPLARSEKDASPYLFRVCPPTAGEQLITSSFDFGILYQAFGAQVYFLAPDQDNSTGRFEFAHSLKVDADLVDVLVYIAQSAGGINDSMQVSVTPIIEIFTRKEPHRDVAKSSSDSREIISSDSGPSLAGAIKKAPFVFSIKAEGIRATCVPGGATRLTESPIIAFSLRRFRLGLAACPVPVQSKLLTDAAMEGIAENKSVVSTLKELHFMVGAWLDCELSASYHNRRLVAWEPFIENWNLEARFGADLVKLLNLPPLPGSANLGWDTDLDRGETPFSAYTGERLRDFRNLLRSPFRRSVGNEKEANAATTKRFPVGSDFGYLLLVLASKSLIAAAIHPSLSSSRDTIFGLKGELESFLPSSHPMKWLKCFGYPRAMADDDTNALSRPAFSVAVTDAKPLNINLTGALIENVLGYLKQEKSRTVAPHWIRNESGLVRKGPFGFTIDVFTFS